MTTGLKLMISYLVLVFVVLMYFAYKEGDDE